MTQDIDPATIAPPEPPTQPGGAVLAQDSAFDAWSAVVAALAETIDAMPPLKYRGGNHGNQHTKARSAGQDDAD